MTRRVYMWVAVISLVGVGLAAAVSSVAEVSSGAVGTGGWTFYTPYSPASLPLAMRIIEACGWAHMLLVPIAALSSAAYILRLDRDVRHGLTSRGFEVQQYLHH